MYKSIIVPVDLSHKERLDKAINTASDLAKIYGASLTFIGVTSSAPTSVAHNPKEFEQVLKEFAKENSARFGIEIAAKSVVSPDPAIDLDETLDDEIHKMGADLVVMASHVPGFLDYVFASNAGFLASHTDISVMIVR